MDAIVKRDLLDTEVLPVVAQCDKYTSDCMGGRHALRNPNVDKARRHYRCVELAREERHGSCLAQEMSALNTDQRAAL